MSPALIRQQIVENMRGFDRVASTRAQTPAAVAVVVVVDDRVPSVPIFQRPLNMSRHPGQMALPGGKVHQGEGTVECAIREVREELGIVVDGADVLGLLDDFDTRSGFTISPVVIWSGVGVNEVQPSASEVFRLFVIGIPELRETASVATAGASDEFSMRFREVEVFAPTAAILYQFSEVALDGRSCRVSDFYQPPFTHR